MASRWPASSESAARRGVEEVRVGALPRAAHAAADLVELGQPELVGALHDQRVRARDVEARLDDRGAHEHVGLAAQEVQHHLLELPLRHLAVGDEHARVGHERADALGGLVDRLHPVVQEEGLAAARQLALDRLGHELVVVLAHVGLHRPAALGRRLDHRDVAQAGQRHLERARDRRGRQRQHVHLQPELAQQLLLLHAEALLLVHDQQAQVLRAHVARQQPVRADQDVDLALVERGERLAHLLRASGSATPSRSERVVAQALLEGAEVLLGEHGRGHQEHHLLAVLGRLERRAQRHLGLAVAHVAADQPVHRARLLHVRAHGLDRLELVGRLAVGEAALELELPLAVVREGVPGAALALGVEVDQLAGERLGGAAGLQLHLLPLLAAELRERRVAARRRPRSG